MPSLSREPESIRCPNCAEWINSEAILCRFCNCGLSPGHFQPSTFCAEMVRKEAARCRYCQSDLPEAKQRKIDMRPFEPRVIRTEPEPESFGFKANLDLINERADVLCAELRREATLSLDDPHVRSYIRELVYVDSAALTMMEKGLLLQKILDELFGFGPLGPLLRDPSVRDIYVYGHNQVHVERVRKGIKTTDVQFKDEEHLHSVISVCPVGCVELVFAT